MLYSFLGTEVFVILQHKNKDMSEDIFNREEKKNPKRGAFRL